MGQLVRSLLQRGRTQKSDRYLSGQAERWTVPRHFCLVWKAFKRSRFKGATHVFTGREVERKWDDPSRALRPSPCQSDPRSWSQIAKGKQRRRERLGFLGSHYSASGAVTYMKPAPPVTRTRFAKPLGGRKGSGRPAADISQLSRDWNRKTPRL